MKWTLHSKCFGLALLAVATLVLSPATAHGQTVRTVYDFPNNAGNTIAPPTQGSDGNLYITITGGASGLGQVVKMPVGGGPVSNVYTITDGSNGTRLANALILGKDGNLYGVAVGGGLYGYGTVFQLTTTGTFTVLYNFTGASDGAYPLASLLQGSDGNLYGTTSEDTTTDAAIPPGYPNHAGGTIFMISPDAGGHFTPVGPGGSTFNLLYTFSNNWTYGLPYTASLVEGKNHVLYGISYAGGDQTYAPSTYGFIYSIPLGGGPLTTVADFTYYNGANPLSMMMAGDGNLYGSCWIAPGSSGTLWEFNLTTNTLSTLYGFPQIGNQISAPTKLVDRGDGFLYGTANYGNLYSTIFNMPIGGGAVTPMYSFSGGVEGGLCYEGMTLGSDSNLYGAALFGGQNSAGNVFEVVFDTTPPTITATPSQSTLWPPNGKTIPVTISGTFTDSGSGIDPTSLSYSVTDSYGQIQPSGSVTVGAGGNYSFTVNLVASRKGSDKAGRTYTITVTGKDKAGNEGSVTTTVTVPHNQ